MNVGDYTAHHTEVAVRTGLSKELEPFRGGTKSRTALIPGVLGGNFLAHNRAIIDISNRALYLRRDDGGGGR